jgi:hypothetical protein
VYRHPLGLLRHLEAVELKVLALLLYLHNLLSFYFPFVEHSVKAVLAKIKIVTASALEAVAPDGLSPTSVAFDVLV